MGRRVATSSATTVFIPRGANGSLFPGAPSPERPASERIVKGTPARLVLPNHPPRLNTALDVQRELSAQKQILRFDRSL